MDRRSFSYLALAVSAVAVLLALIVLSVRVRAVAEPPALDPAELARAAAGSRAATSAPLRAAAREAPASAAPSRAATDRPVPGEGEARAAERHLNRLPRAGAPAAEPPPAEDDAISRASEFYGTGDYESALALAIEYLKADPDNERMLRIATSSYCIMGDAERARPHFERLTPRGQREIARRCARYGIRF